MRLNKTHITLPWMNIIRIGREKRVPDEKILAQLYKYGIKEEKRIEKGLKKDFQKTLKEANKEEKEVDKLCKETERLTGRTG